jgi:hypothetical protein
MKVHPMDYYCNPPNNLKALTKLHSIYTQLSIIHFPLRSLLKYSHKQGASFPARLQHEHTGKTVRYLYSGAEGLTADDSFTVPDTSSYCETHCIWGRGGISIGAL